MGKSNFLCVTDLTAVRTQENVNANRLIEMRGLRPKAFIYVWNFQPEVSPTIVDATSCPKPVGDQRKFPGVNNPQEADGVGDDAFPKAGK
jgi:hypothetical protein